MQKLILVDGNAILHRAFHAMPPFRTPEGELVNAVYGFSSMLLNLLNIHKPDYIAVSFDVKGKTFRHEEYKEYKATRKKAPDELYSQVPRIKEVVRAFQIPIYEIAGFEADDVLGTLSKQADARKDIHTFIVTGDMDLTQLVTPTTFLLTPHKGFAQTKTYDIQAVFEKFGISPAQVPDMKGLQGDSSDNIKGVKGVGPKTTLNLLQKYKTLENVYENLHEITGSTHDKLANDRDSAFLSKHLATIVTDVPLTLDLPECKTHEYDQEKVAQLFEQLGFASLLRKLGTLNSHSNARKQEENEAQPSLF